MTLIGWVQIALVLGLVFAAAFPFGKYMAVVFSGERSLLTPVLGPVERGFYTIAGIDPKRGMGWKQYVFALILLNALHFLLLYAILRLQGHIAVESAACACNVAKAGIQHGGEFRDQHELAGLHAGKPDLVRRADVRADRAHVPFGLDGHCSSRCRDACFHRKRAEDTRQFLRRSHACGALRAAAGGVRCGSVAAGIWRS